MKNIILVIFLVLTLITACRDSNKDHQSAFPPTDSTALKAIPAPDWAVNATIYEVNVRQFSSKGNFKGVEEQLPRLKEMGVDIIWLMPIYPISQTNKKGTLGSPYAVADYKAVNPDYGTIDDLKALVNRTHALGMHIILDWVANHTGMDHVWLKDHPDWYTHVNGALTPPINPETGKLTEWTDVYELNYKNPSLRRAMIDAMSFWVRECGIDGYRCDVASYVPNDFWAEVRPELDKIKTVFMLAESEDNPELFKTCFNMNYSWSMHHIMKAIAEGAATADKIDSVRQANKKRFPPWYYQMLFTQNHDENKNNGTLSELFGPGAEAFVVLTCTLDGMPLIYNGMEAGLNRRLDFFENDTISWGNYGKVDLFQTLLTLKRRNRALWNGLAGGEVVKIPTEHDDKVYAFYRIRETDRVVVLVNLSGETQSFTLGGTGYSGIYTEVFLRQSVEIKHAMNVTLPPWTYRVLTN